MYYHGGFNKGKKSPRSLCRNLFKLCPNLKAREVHLNRRAQKEKDWFWYKLVLERGTEKVFLFLTLDRTGGCEKITTIL